MSNTTADSTGINNNNTKSVDIIESRTIKAINETIKNVPSTKLKTILIQEAPSKANTASTLTATSTSSKGKMLPPPPRLPFMEIISNTEESNIIIQ